MAKENPAKVQNFKDFKIKFIARLILSNMFLAGIFIYLFEIYEFRNYYLIIIFAAYTLKTLSINIIAILGTVKGAFLN